MSLTRQEKEKIVKELKDKFSESQGAIFVDFKGLRFHKMQELRKKLKTIGSEYKIAKKTLANIALRSHKIPHLDMLKMKGPMSIIFSRDDLVFPSKIIYEFSKKESVKILGGFMDKQFFSAEQIIRMAKLPSYKELMAMLLRAINAPISRLANVASANLRNLVYALKEIQTKKQ